MGKRPGRTRLLVALSLIAIAAAFSACTDSQPDEFTGTWRQLDYKAAGAASLVITPSGDGYRVTLVLTRVQPGFTLKRDGDALRGQIPDAGGALAVEIVYQPESGHLTFSNAVDPGGAMTEPEEFMRISTSVATPSPT